MRKIEQLQVLKGYPECLGPTVKSDGILFTCEVPGDKRAELVLTDRDGSILREIELSESERIGDVASLFLKGADSDKIWYYYTIDGEKVLDPYCTGIENGLCRASKGRFEWGEEPIAPTPLNEMMIYKLHVRGFTMKDRISPKKRGTFAGVKEKLSYIRELGFNTIELMPVYAFDEALKDTPYREVREKVDEDGNKEFETVPRHNYWGYADQNFYYAPNPKYSCSRNPGDELKDLIRECHRMGMSVILEFCFPKNSSPTQCVKILRFWKIYYHVDGFHLIGSGVPARAIASDPFLTKTYLFFERVWDDLLTHSMRAGNRHIIEYNSDFQNVGRSLLKSDEGKVGEFSRFIVRNPRSFGCVNYMANVNGFTLCDSVSYDWKHNEDNGEANSDGTDYNLSWNCGAEGPSKKKTVRSLRLRQMKNALAYVFLSQSIPLLYAGDECMNSQNGNNNAYSCDDESGWVSWNRTKDAEELRSFLKELVVLRKMHPILHMDRELMTTDRHGCGYPEISFHDTKAWMFQTENAARTLAVLYCGLYTHEETPEAADFVYTAYNAYWNEHAFALPALPKGLVWEKLFDTAGDSKDSSQVSEDGRFCETGARSVTVLITKQDPEWMKKKNSKRKKMNRALKDANAHEALSKENEVNPEIDNETERIADSVVPVLHQDSAEA